MAPAATDLPDAEWIKALDEIRSYHYYNAYRTLCIPMGDRSVG